MIIVTFKNNTDQKVELVVADRKNLINTLIALENSKSCVEFKVSMSEGHQCKDLKKDFGFGEFSKFVTEFNWGE